MAVPDKWAHWAALLDINIMHTLGIPPFNQGKGGKPSWQGDQTIKRMDAYKVRLHIIMFVKCLLPVILQFVVGRLSTLNISYSKTGQPTTVCGGRRTRPTMITFRVRSRWRWTSLR